MKHISSRGVGPCVMCNNMGNACNLVDNTNIKSYVLNLYLYALNPIASAPDALI